MNHGSARRILVDAAARYLGRSPTLAELQAVQAVAWFESRYGRGWKVAATHNWGAITAPGTGRDTDCPPGTFSARDSDPLGSYQTCFRVYADDDAGAYAVAREVLRRAGVRAALERGSLRELAGAMHATGYFTGTSADPTVNVERYAGHLDRALDAITAELGEPRALWLDAPTPAPRPRGPGVIWLRPGDYWGVPAAGLALGTATAAALAWRRLSA